MRASVAALLAAAGGLWLARGAAAQQPAPPPPPADAAPDLEFLEYLGSWQAGDDEWLEIREWEKDNPPAEADDAQAGDAEETDDHGKPPERSRNEDDESK
jgi:hypothetical protein